MSNEELAVLAKSDRTKLPVLWAQVETFVYGMAYKRYLRSRGMGGVEVEDLYQSGYIALVRAVDTFAPAAGTAFTSWLTFYLKTEFARTGRYYHKKQEQDPLHHAESLDALIGRYGDDRTGDRTLKEIQVDPAAEQAFQDAEDRIWREQLHNALEIALAELPDNLAETIRRRYYAGQTVPQTAACMGVGKNTPVKRTCKALRELRCRQELRQFLTTL